MRARILALPALAASGLLLVAGCVTPQPAPETQPVSMETPAPAPPAPVMTSPLETELSRVKDNLARTEDENARLRGANRALAGENERLREEIASAPLPPVVAAPPPPAVVDIAPSLEPASDPVVSSGPSGSYVIQVATYPSSSKGRKAAEAGQTFFQRKGYEPATVRESGKWLVLEVGAYPDRSSANQARGEIADIAYNGRRGDFASAIVRRR